MHDLPLINLIAAAFVAAWVLGIITQKLKLSPIVGYLLAGVVIGPYTPGFAGDASLAHQLSELGVILQMFGVGLHFHLEELLAVRKVAVPGAIGQSLTATVLGLVIAHACGLSWGAGTVLGVALAVASTVVLIRVLTDNKVLDTQAGHVAVGWLIVEDLLTVVVLVLIPAFGDGGHADPSHPPQSLWIALPMAFVKLAALVVLLLVLGGKFVPWVMVKVAKLRSRELFTLTVLVMAISVAAGSAYFFGVSMALGAFLGGMVVGRSPVSQQAGADVLPLRDAFAVLFFASVGMLFNYHVIYEHPGLLLAAVGVVLIAKPLAALVIIAVIGYPARTGLTVALGLAQVGEFSFILSELGKQNGLLDETGHNVLVGTAILTITLNPLLFRLLPTFEKFLQRWPALWTFMNRKDESRQIRMNEATEATLQKEETSLAVIIGYGPVGRSMDHMLRERGVETVIIDMNVDTIEHLHKQGRNAIYGDAFNVEVIAQALPRATHLLITLPHSQNRAPLIISAKLINPKVKIFVRARYIAEREELLQVGADAACYEEAEAAVALARLVLNDVGEDPQSITHEVVSIRQKYKAVLPA
jgi:CPA2 family monovalent cation:H+ antiporter-2